MILFFIGCILFGFILAIVLAPVIVVRNHRAVSQMRQILEAAEYMNREDSDGYARKRRNLLDALYGHKANIIADTRALIQADDIISRFRDLTS